MVACLRDESTVLADTVTSSSATLTIRGGVVVTATDVMNADVTIAGGTIVGISARSASSRVQGEVIDARGCYVLPGAIDVHTHLEHRVGPDVRTADDFFTGTRAAAIGGTTTIIDFAPAYGGQSLRQALTDRRAAAHGRCVIDYSFHSAITAAGLKQDGGDMREAARAGASTFKVYTAYPGRMMSDDATLLGVFETAADMGCLVLVHAENGHLVAHETQRLLASGETAEHMHFRAHPEAAEVEAVNRVIALAAAVGCDLYIVHVSSACAATAIRRARQVGRCVWGETCPQYLLHCYEEYADLGFDAAKYVCSPPIRERCNQEPLWQALCDDALSTLATDHAPFLLHDEAGTRGDKARGSGYFPNIPNGVPGIEDRMKLLLEYGVTTGRLSICRAVEVSATKPARLMGLYPKKGTIAVGADADLVVWEHAAPHEIRATEQHQDLDYNLYEGFRVSWHPRTVISRGEVIVTDGKCFAEPGRGKFLVRRPLRDGASRALNLRTPPQPFSIKRTLLHTCSQRPPADHYDD
jgi:dihydropyrimidinase